ncbi:MAG: 1-(5-phosphoribosyl)-5-[(5-phosphoribosylamino)methylideneamino]imidazole-4-carboxamide isomerase [Phycisphaerae bacterium]|nr:1-(5-phosphoribosyl)-5-[(5-phosphoribosylamino)methylideneamino]imidazole-4-carboxamide isomerase [Phycisphaerae bacterium]
MEILPAIDLRDGKVVRLEQGDYERQTVYSDDPVAVAETFASAGAGWIHIVDLDAALTGRPTNTASVEAICRAVEARIELGGGARDAAVIDAMLAMGAARVVVGSAALRDWDWFERLVHRADLAGRIALGLDARGGKLTAEGWTKQLDVAPLELARRTRGWPLGAIAYTDISRDGMLAGVNIEATAEIISATDVQVIASGGVTSLDDIRRCKEIGCGGAIIGRAYYEGRIDLGEACRLAAK